VRVVEVGTTRRLVTKDEEVNDEDDDGHVNADDMRSRAIAHAATDWTSLRMDSRNGQSRVPALRQC
jgi:hypothetical protein